MVLKYILSLGKKEDPWKTSDLALLINASPKQIKKQQDSE